MSENKKILIIDDEGELNEIISMRLTKAGYEVDTATDGPSGIEKAKSFLPDTILLDINMPGMDGWQFLEEYAKLPEEQRGGNVIVLLTTSLDAEDQEKAGKIETIEGFQDKPLSVEKIHQLIKEYFPENI